MKYVDAGYAIALDDVGANPDSLALLPLVAPDGARPRVAEASAGPEALSTAGAEQPAPDTRPGGEPR